MVSDIPGFSREEMKSIHKFMAQLDPSSGVASTSSVAFVGTLDVALSASYIASNPS